VHKLDTKLKTRKFFPEKLFVFVLDLQIFYERGAVLKVVIPSGDTRYISVTTPLETCNFKRSLGIGVLEANTFSWIEFCTSPSLSLCISWLTVFTRYLRISLFLFCFLLYLEVKKNTEIRVLFGWLVYYLIYSFDLAGWSLCINKPLFKQNEHFLLVCLTTVNDLPAISLSEVESAFRSTRKDLTIQEEKKLIQLKKITNQNVLLKRKIKIIYWVLQQAAQKNIYNYFSIKTWGSCAELLLYYAQSLRLWIP